MLPKLGIIAGGGELPARLVEHCRNTGRDVFVVALEGQTDPHFVTSVEHLWTRLGAAGSTLEALRAAGVGQLVMAGAIRRPSLAELRPDMRTAKFFATTGAAALGDDGLLSAIIGALEKEGFGVVGIDQILPDMVAAQGVFGNHAPDLQAEDDIKTALSAALAVGAADKGQGAVACRGRVLAVEDADGTDAMLARVAGLRSGDKGGVLVKVGKPGQERRADLPTIGVATIENAAMAGLSGIAIEAGSSLVVDKDAVVRAADAAGIFVIGIEVNAPLVYLIAGEPSGDILGARLMAALKQRGTFAFAGVGGPEMKSQGLVSLFPMEDLSVMGLAEVLPHLPKLIARIRQTRADIRARHPAVLVSIDSPDFCFRVASKLRGEGIKLVHYVAPSVWAWKPGRAKKIAGFLDHLLALLPFEPPYFECHGLETTFVGHPVVESGADSGDGAGFRNRHGIADDAPLLVVLPGSRGGEIRRLLPVFADTVARLSAHRPGLRVVVPAIDRLAAEISTGVADWPTGALVVTGEAEKFDAFAAADVALAASGTVALELAMSATPTVIAYRLNPLTAWVAKGLVKTPYVNLVNIVLGRRAVPEFLLADCRADLLSAAVGELLDDMSARREQVEAAKEALKLLGKDGPPPSGRAADAIIKTIERA